MPPSTDDRDAAMDWIDANHRFRRNVAEIVIRAERRAGEMLAESEKHEGGRPSKTPLIVRGVSIPTLTDLDIDHNQSHRWQRVAGIGRISQRADKQAGFLGIGGINLAH